MCDRCLVNCEAREWKYGDLRSGHWLISSEGWLEEEWEFFEFRGGNVWLMELDASALISSNFVSIFVISISSCSFIDVSNFWCWRCSVCQGGFHKLRIWTKFLWFLVTRAGSVFTWCLVSREGLHSLRVRMKYMWVFILACMSWNLYR